METPKVSVIMPVYKAEKYLRRSVESLLSQTLQDFELLLIDDGSPDASGPICDEYAMKDARVRVFHKANEGVSRTRQLGVDNARGEYIIHADPDDRVEPTMLQELYTKAVSSNADMIICDFFVEFEKEVIYSKQMPSQTDATTVLKELFLNLHGSCCNKLVKRKALLRYNVRFDAELSFCEDIYYNASLLVNPIKVEYLPKAFYYYNQTLNENSIVARYSKESFDYDEFLYNKMVNLLAHFPFIEIVQKRFASLIVSRAFISGLFSSAEFKGRCSKYAPLIKHYSRPADINRYLYYFSCQGYYRIMYNIYRLLKRIKDR